jgi:hypothetical protein
MTKHTSRSIAISGEEPNKSTDSNCKAPSSRDSFVNLSLLTSFSSVFAPVQYSFNSAIINYAKVANYSTRPRRFPRLPEYREEVSEGGGDLQGRTVGRDGHQDDGAALPVMPPRKDDGAPLQT